MISYPQNLIEFMDQFQTEQQCRLYLASVRWKNKFTCPDCGHNQYWLDKRNRFICASCRSQVSVLSGTVMQDTKLHLRTWMTAMWLFATQKDGISAMSLRDNLGIHSYRSAWTLLHTLRVAMIRSDREPLSGMVEVDEAYVGGYEEGGKRGRGCENKYIVAVAVQLDKIQMDRSHDVLRDYRLAKIRIKHVASASKEELHTFILENVASGSMLYRDDWSGYSGIDELGYTSVVFKASKANDKNEKLPHVHLAISLLERWIMGTYQGHIEEYHLQAYLEEFTFRFNRKTSTHRGLLFYRLVQGTMSTIPHPYENLIEPRAKSSSVNRQRSEVD
jgi:transposase-like protein